MAAPKYIPADPAHPDYWMQREVVALERIAAALERLAAQRAPAQEERTEPHTRLLAARKGR